MDMITVITPIAPYHVAVANEARQSVESQTVPAKWLAIVDNNERGPAWARNQGVKQATTPYIFFLDADDILEPDALLHAAERHERNTYTYGDWIHHEKGIQVMPDCYRWNTKSHVISVLMHRNIYYDIGGFNEQIDFEDTEFFLRAMKRGICGVRSPHPFIQYRPIGQRSLEAKENRDKNQYFSRLREEYRGMSCCGDAEPAGVVNEQQSGDVLVEASWTGNKATKSSIDGRQYPRAGWGSMLYVSAHDAAAGFLLSGTGRVPIRTTYVEASEPITDYEGLKRWLLDRQNDE